MTVHAYLSPDEIDVFGLEELVADERCGAVVTFRGDVRSPNQGVAVERLDYEVYERVAVDQMRSIGEDVARSTGVAHIAVAHRSGPVRTGETAFVVVVAGAHRSEAFSACSSMVDRVKSEVAIWKTEVTKVESVVANRTSNG